MSRKLGITGELYDTSLYVAHFHLIAVGSFEEGQHGWVWVLQGAPVVLQVEQAIVGMEREFVIVVKSLKLPSVGCTAMWCGKPVFSTGLLSFCCRTWVRVRMWYKCPCVQWQLFIISVILYCMLILHKCLGKFWRTVFRPFWEMSTWIGVMEYITEKYGQQEIKKSQIMSEEQ